jgi:hypothetical protein
MSKGVHDVIFRNAARAAFTPNKRVNTLNFVGNLAFSLTGIHSPRVRGFANAERKSRFGRVTMPRHVPTIPSPFRFKSSPRRTPRPPARLSSTICLMLMATPPCPLSVYGTPAALRPPIRTVMDAS